MWKFVRMATRCSSRRRGGTSARILREECRLRRLLHLALLLAVVLGIGACGGMAVTEDRLNAATRGMAERIGLKNSKDAFDAAVRPPMAAATRSLSDSIYVTTARAMDSMELAAGSFSGWIIQ